MILSHYSYTVGVYTSTKKISPAYLYIAILHHQSHHTWLVEPMSKSRAGIAPGQRACTHACMYNYARAHMFHVF